MFGSALQTQMLVDIVEPRYGANIFYLLRVNLFLLGVTGIQSSTITNITLRLSEVIQELKLKQQLELANARTNLAYNHRWLRELS